MQVQSNLSTMINFVPLQGENFLGSQLNVLCSHQHLFALAVGTLKDCQPTSALELALLHICLAISLSPEVNFSWPCGVSSYACEAQCSVHNSSRSLGGSPVPFLCVSASSAVLCPVNYYHPSLPKLHSFSSIQQYLWALRGFPVPVLSSRNCLQAKS